MTGHDSPVTSPRLKLVSAGTAGLALSQPPLTSVAANGSKAAATVGGGAVAGRTSPRGRIARPGRSARPVAAGPDGRGSQADRGEGRQAGNGNGLAPGSLRLPDGEPVRRVDPVHASGQALSRRWARQRGELGERASPKGRQPGYRLGLAPAAV